MTRNGNVRQSLSTLRKKKKKNKKIQKGKKTKSFGKKFKDNIKGNFYAIFKQKWN